MHAIYIYIYMILLSQWSHFSHPAKVHHFGTGPLVGQHSDLEPCPMGLPGQGYPGFWHMQWCLRYVDFHVLWVHEHVVGGFKDFLCSSLFGEDEPILTNIFQMGWNHQLDTVSKIARVMVLLLWCSWLQVRPTQYVCDLYIYLLHLYLYRSSYVL